jgi:hypothetical protein
MQTVKKNHCGFNNRISFYICFLALVLFFPGLISFFGLAVEQGLTILIFGVSILCLLLFKTKLSFRVFYVSFCFYAYFQISVIISLLRSTDIFISSDLVEIFKPLYLYVFFILPYCILREVDDLYRVSYSLMFFCIILSLFGIFESWTSIGYNISTFLYKPARAVLKDKAVASFIITYTFASFMILPFFYFITKFLSEKKVFNINIMISFIMVFCIFSTQSKTVFIGLFFTLALFFLCYLIYGFTINKKRVLVFIFCFIISLLLGIGVLMELFEDKLGYIYSGLEIVLSSFLSGGVATAIYSTPSVFLRFEQLEFALNQQDTIPLIGVAIGKSVLMPESIYALYIYRFGLIGLILHFIMLWVLIKKSYHCASFFAEFKDKHLYSFFMAIHFYALSLPLSYFSSAVNDQTRTGFVFYFLIASTLFISTKIEESKNVDFDSHAII